MAGGPYQLINNVSAFTACNMVQQSDPAMGGCLYRITSIGAYLPDLSLDNPFMITRTIMNFRQLLENTNSRASFLKKWIDGCLMQAFISKRTLWDADYYWSRAGSTKIKTKKGDLEMTSSSKGLAVFFFWLLKPIGGVDARTGLTHSSEYNGGQLHDITKQRTILMAEECFVSADPGICLALKREKSLKACQSRTGLMQRFRGKIRSLKKHPRKK